MSKPKSKKKGDHSQRRPGGHNRPKRQAKKGKGKKQSMPMPEITEELDLSERQEKELQENLTTWLAVLFNKDKMLAYQLGHQFEDLIIRCTMKNSNCTNAL